MADAENAVATKKRIAGRQISKDNLELDDDSSEPEMGTFQRASEEVLATRRIVKVRRQQTASNASSNPFAGIRLVSSSEPNAKTDAQVEFQSHTDKQQPNRANDKNEVLLDEANGTGESNKLSECNTGIPKATVNEIEKNTFEVLSQPLETAADVKDVKNESDGNLTNNPDNKNSEEIDGQAVENPKEAPEETQEEVLKMSRKNVERTMEGEAEENNLKEAASAVSTFSSFGQLSSSQNAFTSLSGTGFGTSSFSFGPLKDDGSTFNSFSFTSTNNGMSSLPLFCFSGTESAKNGVAGGPSLQEVSVETGEENEKSVFTADATLYEYLDGSWKERGRGEVKVNISVSGEKARLVMRAKGNYRLILNANLYKDMTLANMDKKGISFSCINSAGEGSAGLTTFALKFRDSSFAEEFCSVVTEHKGKNVIVPKTPECSPKASDE